MYLTFQLVFKNLKKSQIKSKPIKFLLEHKTQQQQFAKMRSFQLIGRIVLIGFSAISAENSIKESDVKALDEFNSINNVTNRIIGGKKAYPGLFPWMVSLQLSDRNSQFRHFCGGSIIDEHLILTSAYGL